MDNWFVELFDIISGQKETHKVEMLLKELYGEFDILVRRHSIQELKEIYYYTVENNQINTINPNFNEVTNEELKREILKRLVMLDDLSIPEEILMNLINTKKEKDIKAYINSWKSFTFVYYHLKDVYNYQLELKSRTDPFEDVLPDDLNKTLKDEYKEPVKEPSTLPELEPELKPEPEKTRRFGRIKKTKEKSQPVQETKPAEEVSKPEKVEKPKKVKKVKTTKKPKPIKEKVIEKPVEVIKEVVVEKPIEVVKEVPVEKEVIKEVIVEKPVEKEVVKEIITEKPVEIIKEVVVEKPVEVIKEVIVEKPVEKEVIKEVEKVVEVPVEKEIIKEVPVEKEVIKEVIVEKPVEKEVIKEVIVEKPVEVIKEVIVEKPVEVVKEVIKEVEVEKEVIKEVIVEKPVEKEVIKEVIVEKPVEVIKEVIKEVEVPVEKEVIKESTTETPVKTYTPEPTRPTVKKPRITFERPEMPTAPKVSVHQDISHEEKQSLFFTLIDEIVFRYKYQINKEVLKRFNNPRPNFNRVLIGYIEETKRDATYFIDLFRLLIQYGETEITHYIASKSANLKRLLTFNIGLLNIDDLENKLILLDIISDVDEQFIHMSLLERNLRLYVDSLSLNDQNVLKMYDHVNTITEIAPKLVDTYKAAEAIDYFKLDIWNKSLAILDKNNLAENYWAMILASTLCVYVHRKSDIDYTSSMNCVGEMAENFIKLVDDEEIKIAANTLAKSYIRNIFKQGQLCETYHDWWSRQQDDLLTAKLTNISKLNNL